MTQNTAERIPVPMPGTPEIWFELSHLASVYGLNAVERQVIYKAGIYAREKWHPTIRHASYLRESLWRLEGKSWLGWQS